MRRLKFCYAKGTWWQQREGDDEDMYSWEHEERRLFQGFIVHMGGAIAYFSTFIISSVMPFSTSHGT